jgi:hypothetical protein
MARMTGLVLWQIFTRKEPFYGLPLYEMMNKIIHENFRPPIDEIPGNDLRELICQCWHPDPDIRPEFAEILQRLQRLAKPQSVIDMEEAAGPRTRRTSVNAPSSGEDDMPDTNSMQSFAGAGGSASVSETSPYTSSGSSFETPQ